MDRLLLIIAAINYRLLEIEKMIKPRKVEEYYPEDPFEGLTDEEINAILKEEEEFYNSLNEKGDKNDK